MLARKETQRRLRSNEYPAAWLPALRNLVLWMQRDDIRTESALLAALAGDAVAGLVLQDLLDLMQRSIRADGAIWQPDTYWLTHRGITYPQMRRTRRRLLRVATIWREKAQGAPTYHYLVRKDALVTQLAFLAGRSPSFVRSLLVDASEQKAGFTKSITESVVLTLPLQQTTKTEPVGEVVNALVAAGLTPATAQQFSGLDADVVKGMIEQARLKQAQGQIKKGLAAYLTGALRNIQQKAATAAAASVLAESALKPKAQVSQILGPQPLPAELPEQDCWEKAAAELKAALPGEMFDLWVKDAALLRVDGGNWTVGVKNAMAAEVLGKRVYHRVIEAAAGAGATALKFEVI